jgi:hypothetical protein
MLALEAFVNNRGWSSRERRRREQVASAEAVRRFVDATTWDQIVRLLESFPHLLLSEDADEAFVKLLEQHKDKVNAPVRIVEHHKLLRRCRDKGIDAAFADPWSPPSPAEVRESGLPVVCWDGVHGIESLEIGLLDSGKYNQVGSKIMLLSECDWVLSHFNKLPVANPGLSAL